MCGVRISEESGRETLGMLLMGDRIETTNYAVLLLTEFCEHSSFATRLICKRMRIAQYCVVTRLMKAAHTTFAAASSKATD